MTDKEILTALENALEFWQGELSRATRLEVIQFRKGDIIKYEPAKGMPGYAESMVSEKAARRLADIDLLASFSF